MNREELYINYLLGNIEEIQQKQITRTENYLYTLRNGYNYLEPMTTEECYLYAIVNNLDCNIKPITREEKYLYYLLGNHIDLPIPITEKEKLYKNLIDNNIIFGNYTYFSKWENGDYDWNTGLPKEDSTRVRTPLDYKKRLKPNTKYRVTTDEGLTWGLRTYKKNKTFIGTFSSTNTTNGIFTTKSDTSYGLMMITTTDTNKVVKLQELPTLEVGAINVGNGKNEANTGKVRTKDYITIKKNTEYKVTVTNATKANAVRYMLYNSDNSFNTSGYFNVSDGLTFNSGKSTKIRFYLNGLDNDANIIIEPTGNIFTNAILVKGIWIANDNISNSATGARCWVIPCKANTTYSITRASNTSRGVIGSVSTFPQIANGKLDKNCVGLGSSNTKNYTTTENSKYLIIYFAVNTEEYNNVKWVIKETEPINSINNILADSEDNILLDSEGNMLLSSEEGENK